MKYPSCDVLASNGARRIAIECKTSRDKSKYLEKDEAKQLKDFSSIFGAEAWIGVRFDREDWLFITLEDIKDTGNNFLVSLDIAKKKGLTFDELIEK